ncbi:RNA polymerase factor sigma-54 [Sporosarcina sp. FSL K6-3457]|uniref:RNA polymerase factor sigma-54 n=1 Tax=Sporosarcina sp. FSL K6-3457 TaxID=2978204 RepID=UPI0030F69141
MDLALHQKQELHLKMTFELRQAIELLQYSTYELEQYIRQQELENPLIELKEKDDHFADEDRFNRPTKSPSSSDMSIDANESHDTNMRDELFELAKLLFTDVQTQRLLNYLIYNLDDNGYLQFQDLDYMRFDEQQINDGIRLLQAVGPTGIGARNLKECLLLQIEYDYPEEQLAMLLVKDHLELVANRKWNDIATTLNISLAQVKELFDFIQTLNPRPCSFISDFSATYTTPDVIVELKNEELVFRINDGFLPSIQMNKDYAHHLNAKDELSTHIHDYYKSYQWLLTSIEQRRNTMLKIMGVLLEKQHDFFKKGSSFLKPLTLGDVAKEIDMHESTVSRATMNKVMQTPFGSFDLRILFTSKVTTVDGDSISQSNVKALLQSFVAQENKFKPYSDQKIADYFKTEEGITISRRTISKYREELRIPPSSRRKEIEV